MAIFPALSKALLTRSLPLTTTLVLLAGATPLAQAQVTPDATLGNEASIVTPNVPVRGSEADLIEGGALRGSNLFHSFLEFNVDAGQRLYFANPAGVESILSRITGGNPSAIFGTLGVDGAADLFLINPNGLVFGETATLDIQGSFYASTAEAILLGDGVYSATAPEQSTLLTVNPSALFSNYLSETSGNIESRAPLAAGENLTLAANQLDLQRQVAAGGNLTLLGNTVQIRDAVNAPFVGFSGGDLLVQGNEQVDIVALSHPNSGLYSYGDMVLRSANPVGGDAHYWSGSNFTVETLDGSGGSLFSPVDPIIRSFGDVFFEVYVGSSLHILAGGAVTIGTAIITAPALGNLEVDFLQEAVTLSDSTVVQVDGGAQPTLDVRAGIRQEALGTLPIELLTGFNPNFDAFFGNRFSTNTPSSTDITIGDVLIAAPNGLVLLTNQYQPHANLTGGNISVTGEGVYGDGIDARGGSVYLDSRNNVSIINSFIDTTGLGTIGNTVINANGAVLLNRADGSRTGIFANISSMEQQGIGGNVRINAQNFEVLSGAQIQALVLGEGKGGNIIVNIRDAARFVGFNPDDGIISGVFSGIFDEGKGTGGDVQITARNLEVLDGAQISVSISGTGDAGNVVLDISELARFAGRTPGENNSPSGAFSSVIFPNGAGRGGNVIINAQNLEVSDGAQISASTSREGDAGSVILNITELARFDGSDPFTENASGAFSNIQSDGKGMGGNVRISAQNLEVLNGAQLSASTFGHGDAGDVILNIADLARFDGFNPFNNSGGGAISRVQQGGKGRGGNVQISANNLDVSNGAQVSASSAGEGDAGNVVLNIAELARFEGLNPITGSPSGAFSSIQENGKGTGGNLQITAANLEILNDAVLTANSLGIGNSGNVILLVSNQLLVNNGIVATNAEAASGGQVNIQAGQIILRNDSDIQTFVSRGEGGGGNITIASNFLIALEDSDILAFSADGRGGVIDLSRTTFFGQNPSIAARNLSRNELLDLDGNDRVDINATGGVESGQIFVGDATFVENSLTALTDAIVDTSALTAGSCIARSQDSLGSFVVTGRDGLPATPGDGGISAYPTGTVRAVDEPAVTGIQEPDGVYQLPNGRLVLSRACN